MSGPNRHKVSKAVQIFTILVLVFPLSACSGLYEVSLNDRLVYDPYPDENRERNALLADTNLQGCLNEIDSENVGESSYMSTTFLACSSAGVSTLEGIENLKQLEQLDLSSNSITDLNDLAQLNNLRLLSLSNNRIRDIRALYNLPLLRSANLIGNNAIPCGQLDRLEDKIGNGLTRPVSCQN